MNYFDKKYFKILSEIIQNSIGVVLESSKIEYLYSKLEKRIKKLKLKSFEEYIDYIKKNNNELYEIVKLSTIKETSFFRHSSQFNILNFVMIQSILNKRDSNEEIVIWSATCSTGEEPYSIAISLDCRHQKAFRSDKIKIIATDINDDYLSAATQGCYDIKKMETVPEDIRNLYFDKISDNEYRIKKFIKDKIIFQKLNLISDKYPENIDIIFCRNTLYYFDIVNKFKIIIKLYKSLNKNGFLLLSPTESLSGYAELFRKYEFEQLSYYEKRTTIENTELYGSVKNYSDIENIKVVEYLNSKILKIYNGFIILDENENIFFNILLDFYKSKKYYQKFIFDLSSANFICNLTISYLKLIGYLFYKENNKIELKLNDKISRKIKADIFDIFFEIKYTQTDDRDYGYVKNPFEERRAEFISEEKILYLNSEIKDNVYYIHIEGCLDLNDLTIEEKIKESYLKILKESAKYIVVIFKNITFIDYTFFDYLLRLKRTIENTESEIILVYDNENIDRILYSKKINILFSIFENSADAEEYLKYKKNLYEVKI